MPGPQLIVDEMISPYEGMDSAYCVEGMPGKVSIQRKPRGIGIELKALADGSSKVILYLEIQEGQKNMKNKEYCRELGAGTSQCLRLTKQYSFTNRVVIADAMFASVKTLVSLREINGLYFTGCVKIAHKEYPKNYLQSWYETLHLSQDRSKHYLVKSKYRNGNEEMYGIAWADKKCFTLISNVGTTRPGL